FVEKSLLQWMQPSVNLQAFNGCDFLAHNSFRLDAARADGFALDQHGAGAAFAFPTTIFGPGQPNPVAQHVKQMFSIQDFSFVFGAVDGESNNRHDLSESLW